LFDFYLSNKFQKVLVKLSKKSPQMALAVNRKIKEIINRDHISIMLYKNLRKDLKNLKRVHITNWLVMTFEVDLENDCILFVDVGDRDKIYK